MAAILRAHNVARNAQWMQETAIDLMCVATYILIQLVPRVKAACQILDVARSSDPSVMHWFVDTGDKYRDAVPRRLFDRKLPSRLRVTREVHPYFPLHKLNDLIDRTYEMAHITRNGRKLAVDWQDVRWKREWKLIYWFRHEETQRIKKRMRDWMLALRKLTNASELALSDVQRVVPYTIEWDNDLDFDDTHPAFTLDNTRHVMELGETLDELDEHVAKLFHTVDNPPIEIDEI